MKRQNSDALDRESRRHQSKGSLAASWALSMLAGGKRAGGAWDYRKRRNFDASVSRDERRFLGLIADYAPDLLYQVRDDHDEAPPGHFYR